MRKTNSRNHVYLPLIQRRARFAFFAVQLFGNFAGIDVDVSASKNLLKQANFSGSTLSTTLRVLESRVINKLTSRGARGSPKFVMHRWIPWFCTLEQWYAYRKKWPANAASEHGGFEGKICNTKSCPSSHSWQACQAECVPCASASYRREDSNLLSWFLYSKAKSFLGSRRFPRSDGKAAVLHSSSFMNARHSESKHFVAPMSRKAEDCKEAPYAQTKLSMSDFVLTVWWSMVSSTSAFEKYILALQIFLLENGS